MLLIISDDGLPKEWFEEFYWVPLYSPLTRTLHTLAWWMLGSNHTSVYAKGTGSRYLHSQSPIPDGIRTNSLGVNNISNSWQLNKKVKETLLRRFLSYLYQTLQAQQCIIQSDVEQLLKVPSVHSLTLVHHISHMLLKATDLDWIQIYSKHLNYDEAVYKS